MRAVVGKCIENKSWNVNFIHAISNVSSLSNLNRVAVSNLLILMHMRLFVLVFKSPERCHYAVKSFAEFSAKTTKITQMLIEYQ